MDALNSAYGYGNKFAINRPGSMSETNLLKYRPHKDAGLTSTVRPESALGLLQGAFDIVICKVLEFKYPQKKISINAQKNAIPMTMNCTALYR